MSAPVITLPPYAEALGIRVVEWRDGVPVVAIDYDEGSRGNPGMLHGGVIGGLLEVAALAALDARRADPAVPALKPLSSTIQYLRVAGEGRTFAMAEIVRTGRRLGNLHVEAWQDDPSRPVAVAQVVVAAT